MRTTTGALWLGIIMGWGLLTSGPAAADPRGELRLTWTAPGLPGQPAVAYEVRTAYTPIGADTTAWWNAAVPVSGEPVPASPGTPQSMVLDGFQPGRIVHAAMRAQYAGGAWSAVTAVPPLALPGGPFLQAVSPAGVTGGGVRAYTLTGAGLGTVSVVRFRDPTGAVVEGSGLQITGDTSVIVNADLGALADGPVAVLATAWPGEDALSGWITVDMEDTEPPVTVADLHAAAVTGTSARLTWTAPADPSPRGPRRVAAYEVRRLGGSPGAWSWAEGTVLASRAPALPGTMESLLVSGLDPEGTYGFALTAVDSAGNVSDPSNIAVVTLPAEDTTVEPEAVDDLAAAPLDTSSVRLTWTAPALPGAAGPETVAFYELRRLGGTPGNWSWTSGTVIPAAAPLAPGEAETLTVSGLPPGTTVAFAIISSDGDGEWSRVSNTAEAVLPRPPDVTPPAAVGDLDFQVDGEGEVELAWTAPADEGEAASAYVLKRWNSDPDSFDWDQAATLEDPPPPAPPGQRQKCAAGAVAAGRMAVFALRSRDEEGNWSALSNLAVVDLRNVDAIAPAAPGQMTASRFGASGVQVRWYAPGDDGMSGRADRYELRHTLSPAAEGWEETAEEIPLAGTPKPSGKVEFVNLRNLAGGVVHLFALRAFDEAGQASPWATALVHVDAAGSEATDAAPPPAPDSLVATRGDTGVRLSWSPVGIADLAGYRIYRCGTDGLDRCLGDVAAPATLFLDAAAPSCEVRYAVSAVDASGAESRLGALVTVSPGPAASELGLARAGSSWRLELREPAPGGFPSSKEEPRVEVFDVQGRLVSRIPMTPAGDGWEANWTGRSLAGRPLPNGVFFLRVHRGDRQITRKIVLR